MTPPRHDHAVFDELAVGWALHALEPEDETLFGRHLPDCARCARTVAETQEVMGAMAADLPAAEPSEGLRSRLRDAVAQTEQVRRPAHPGSRGASTADPATHEPATDPGVRLPAPLVPGSRATRPQRALLLTLAAAVAGIVGLGLWNVVLSSDRDRAVEVAAEQSAVVEELLRPGAQVVAQMSDEAGRPLATVVAHESDLQVVSHGLPVNDDTAQTYVLWGVEDDVPVALGTFDVNRSRLDVHAVVSPPTGAGSFTQYAVSLEPGRQPPPKPSEVVATGAVNS